LVELHGIEASSERSIDIFHHPVGNLFFDLLEFTLDPSRIDLLAKTVTAGLWGLSFSESISLIHKIKTLGTKDTNEIDNLISDDINDSELHNLLVESFSFANLDNVMKLLSVVTPKDVLEKIKSTLN
jgi:hypothetical protein